VVLREACAVVGMDHAGAELLRMGSNAVYRLPVGQVIVRIASGAGRGPAVADRTVRVARWLAGEDFPAARLVGGVVQPVVVGSGGVVTFWEDAQGGGEYADLVELAELLRRLHWLAEPEALGLPYYDPFARVSGALAVLESAGVSEGDRSFLEARARRLCGEYERLDFVLPFGLVHGDANVGNAIRDRAGQALLIDLDDVSLGHREWDLVLTALFYDRFGWHTRTEYAKFVHHYGFDLMTWPGYPVLADIRELMMVLWLGRQVSVKPEAAAEFVRRVETLRTDGSRRGWKPF